MKNNKQITKELIEKMSYTDFVGFINQWNVLPGAHVTLSKWINYSSLTKNSKVLEVACTTGFSSREIALDTNCSGIGFDISESSVAMAKYNKKKYAPKIRINYFVADGYKFTSKEKFTHIIFGASLRFFPDPSAMLIKSIGMLKDRGYILSCEFYTPDGVPEHLIKEAQKIFGITPTQVGYKEVMRIYKGLEVIYEDRNELVQETNEELDHYCKSTVDRACQMHAIKNEAVYKAMYDRILRVKDMSNKLRTYQKYNVLVARYRKDVYPSRFIELF